MPFGIAIYSFDLRGVANDINFKDLTDDTGVFYYNSSLSSDRKLRNRFVNLVITRYSNSTKYNKIKLVRLDRTFSELSQFCRAYQLPNLI